MWRQIKASVLTVGADGPIETSNLTEGVFFFHTGEVKMISDWRRRKGDSVERCTACLQPIRVGQRVNGSRSCRGEEVFLRDVKLISATNRQRQSAFPLVTMKKQVRLSRPARNNKTYNRGVIQKVMWHTGPKTHLAGQHHTRAQHTQRGTCVCTRLHTHTHTHRRLMGIKTSREEVIWSAIWGPDRAK